MSFQFTHPLWLLALLPALGWVVWWTWRSDVQINAWRRWAALGVRLAVLLALVLAIAGLQWLRPLEGMNVIFLLDRSESIPSVQQEFSRKYVNQAAVRKKKEDKAGVGVFAADAALESTAQSVVDLLKINAVVGADRTDLAGAIRLGTAAFPEAGQKRLLLLSDGNENTGDALAAVLAARSLGVSVDVVPLGVERGGDVSVQKFATPGRVKKGATFEAKIFINSDTIRPAAIRLFRDEQYLGEKKVDLVAGKNLYTFPQTLSETGFHTYRVAVDAPGDTIPQNNAASSFTSVRGDPRLLIISAKPEEDASLAAALRSANLEVILAGLEKFPDSLAEMQSYDAIFLSNIAAGDLGLNTLRLLESAVRDFGVGLVCVGGEQTYLAGGYKGSPLEAILPVDMELDSKKVLPPGAVALVMHGMEFMNGNQVARDCAMGVLEALGPRDELGVVLWNGAEQWCYPLQAVGSKSEARRAIATMNQGDLPDFEGVVGKAFGALEKSHASLKHIIVFSDGDPVEPSDKLMQSIVGHKITLSTVLIAGHAGPDRMMRMAEKGRGQFYNVKNPDDLPQIFIKETMVVLKSAIYEEPFKPRLVLSTEPLRGLGADYPSLRGYVCTQAKPRAEVPLLTDKGDPLLAHWQFGLGRAVAFTSDAKAKWATDWLDWPRYRQFWSQIAQWSLRRVETSEFAPEVTLENGEGHLNVEALDKEGNYRNFLSLYAAVVSPKGEHQTVRLEQTGPGHYEARFPTRSVGAYLLNLMEIKEGQVRGTQPVGASVNYSPEFNATEPNLHLLRRLAEAGGGKVLDPDHPGDNPFLHDRKKTFQPRDLWEWLLKLAIVLFPLDVGVRRIQIDRDEWRRWWARGRGYLTFWPGKPRPPQADDSLNVLLARREQVRARHSPEATSPLAPQESLFQPVQEVDVPVAPGATSPEGSTRPPPPGPEIPKPDQPTTTTSRLLEAKRRAMRK